MELQQRILLVEDNEDDVLLFRRALKQSDVSASFQSVEDGQQAIDYLTGSGRFGDRRVFPFPTRVFLDLKMPYKGGLEVLEWIRQRQFEASPDVFILTSSAETRDVGEAQRLGAQAYFLKPIKHETLKQLLREEVAREEFQDNILSKIPPTQTG